MELQWIAPNLPVADIDSARAFYTDFLGLSNEEMNLGWVTRFTSPDGRWSVQLVTGDASADVNAVLSVRVADLAEAHRQAVAAGYEIVHPLGEEEWGVRRFMVRAPDGNVVNVTTHQPR